MPPMLNALRRYTTKHYNAPPPGGGKGGGTSVMWSYYKPPTITITFSPRLSRINAEAVRIFLIIIYFLFHINSEGEKFELIVNEYTRDSNLSFY